MNSGDIRRRHRFWMAAYAAIVFCICWLLCYGNLVNAHNDLVLDGIKQLKAHDADRAQLELTDALAKVPEDGHCSYLLALAHAQKHQFSQALLDLEAAARNGEAQARVLTLRASMEAQMRSYNQAIEDATSAIVAAPKNSQAYAIRAFAHCQSGEYQAALSDCAEALPLCTDKAVRARLLKQQTIAQAQLSIKPMQKAITEPGTKAAPSQAQVRSSHPLRTGAGTIAGNKLPADTHSLMKLGYRHMQDQSYDDAIACFARAVRNDKNDGTARRYLAYALCNQGQFASAATQLQALGVIEPLNENDNLILATCLAGTGENEGATPILSRLLRKHPNSVPVRIALAKIYFSTGYPRKARNLCRQGLVLAQTDGEKQALEALLTPQLEHRNGADVHKEIASQQKVPVQ